MESHGLLRLKLALECIDRHPGEYEEKTAQNEMLRDIIRQHNLTETVTRRLGRSTRRIQQELTVESYRTSLGSASRHKSSSKHKEKSWVQALLIKGSVMLDAEWLTKIGYEAPEPAEDDESDHENIRIKGKGRGRSKARSEDEYAPEEVAQATTIDDSDDAAAATLKAASRAASELSTVAAEAEEPMAGSSQEKPNAGRDNGPGLQEGLAQMKKPSKNAETRAGSPRQKRKSDRTEEDLPHSKRRQKDRQDMSGLESSERRKLVEVEQAQPKRRLSMPALGNPADTELTRKRETGEEEFISKKKTKAPQGIEVLDSTASAGSAKSSVDEIGVPADAGVAETMQRVPSETQKPPESRLGARGNPTRGLLRLGDDDVIGPSEGIWFWVQNFSRDLFAEIRNDHDDAPAPSFELYPELHELYQILFGDNWQKQAAVLSQTESISALQLVEAVLSAAMYKAVWQTKAPWKEANDFMDAIAEVEEYINRIQREFSREHRIHTIMWHAIANRARDEGFRETTMRPHAEDLADKIMLTLSRLLNGLKTKNVEESFWPKAKQRVVRMLMQALTLKAKMNAAPNYYQWTWPKSGEKVDDERMEHIRQGEGEQEVLWGVTPVIERRDTKDDLWVLSSRAKVWCRPPMKR